MKIAYILQISPIYQPQDATKKEENDSNNNFQPSPILPKVPSPFFRETVIKPDFLYAKPPLLISPTDIPKDPGYFVAQNLLKPTTCRYNISFIQFSQNKTKRNISDWRRRL